MITTNIQNAGTAVTLRAHGAVLGTPLPLKNIRLSRRKVTFF